MSVDDTGNDPALETASGENVQSTEQPEVTEDAEILDASGAEPDAEQSAEPDDGLDELDFGFKKYRVDKELKSAVEALRADATKKHQDASQRQKALDERESSLKQQAQATEEELAARGQLHQIDAELKKYDNVDWVSLASQDPAAYQQHEAYVKQLTRAKTGAESRLKELQAQKSDQAQQDFAKRAQETAAFAKTLPGYSPERIGKVVKFAEENGISEDFVRSNLSPTLMKFLYFAQIGHEMATKQAAAKPKTAQQPPAEPLTTVKGKSSPGAGRTLADMAASGDMEAYAKARASGRVR